MNACPRITTDAVRSRLSPRIGRSRALSRPWSVSTRLFSGMKELALRVVCAVRDVGFGWLGSGCSEESARAGRCTSRAASSCCFLAAPATSPTALRARIRLCRFRPAVPQISNDERS